MKTTFEFADTTAHFPFKEESGRVGLELCPTAMNGMFGEDIREPQGVDMLVQVKLAGDPYSGGFAQGHTMRNSLSLDAFKFAGREVAGGEGETTVTTSLENGRGHSCPCWTPPPAPRATSRGCAAERIPQGQE